MSKPSSIWRSRDPLTLLEAAALLADVDPADVEFNYTASKPKHADGGVLAAYVILEDAVMAGELAAEVGHELLYAAVSRDREERSAYQSAPSHRYTKIKQQDLTAWARKRGVSLGFIADAYEASVRDEPLTSNRAAIKGETYNKLLAAIEAFNPDNPPRSKKTFMGTLEKQGCDTREQEVFANIAAEHYGHTWRS